MVKLSLATHKLKLQVKTAKLGFVFLVLRILLKKLFDGGASRAVDLEKAVISQCPIEIEIFML